MSYCRASNDDFRCDLYIYESSVGWVTNVCGSKTDLPDDVYPPQVPFGPSVEEFAVWLARKRAVTTMINEAGLVPIGLPHDGESFCDATPGECADRAESLRALGYRVPQYAIDQLRRDQEEME